MATEIKVRKFTTTYTTDKDGYTIKLFGDGALIKEQEFGYSVPIADGQRNTIFSAENFGVYTADFNTKYVLATPEPPPPPPPSPAPTPVAKDTKLKQPRYMPEFSYTEPKSTSGGEFVFKKTGNEYKGFYIKTTDNKYYSGKKPEDNGEELQEITPNYLEDLQPLIAIIPGLLKGFFSLKLKKGDKEKGKTKRFFIQPKTTQKISEVDKQTYRQAQNQLINYNFAEIDWIIAGPAEDKNFNGYPFEGAASKNKKAIQALEKQMPGISTFITDYSFLVEDPTANLQPVLLSTTEVVKDPLIQLENDRKANFDLRK
jgi:hypothetical protein